MRLLQHLPTLAAVAVITVSGVDYASAASGADTTLVAACDEDGVAATFDVSYASELRSYAVTAVELAGLDGSCAGQTVTVTVADPAGAPLSGQAAVVDGAVVTVPLEQPVAADEVARLSVVLTD